MTTEKLDQEIQKTTLYTSHQTLNAKMIPFAGFAMPISYQKGIQSEYFSVRNDIN